MRRAIDLIAAVFCLLFPGTIHAGDTYGAGTPMQVTLMQQEAQTEVPFYSAFITAGEKKFTFVVPQGFRVKGDPATGKLIIGNLEGDCSVSFSILSSTPVEGGQVNEEACRALVLKQHPGGKILEGFCPRVCGKSGQGFDIQWKAAENLYQYERIAFVPTAFGFFVFTASSGRSRFSETQGNLGLIMATFRGSTNGKFDPVHIMGVN